MEKRNRNQFQYGLKPGDLTVTGEIQVSDSASPSVSLTVPDTNHGLKSASRTGAGAYTINLSDKFLGMSGFSAVLEGETSDGYMVKLYGEWLAGVDTVNMTGKQADGYLKILVVDDASAAKDPLGHNIWLTIRCKTSEQG